MSNYAFIDSQNLHLGVKEQGWELDFARFRIYLADKSDVEKAFLFIGYVPGNEGLYKYFQEAGYIVIFKPTLAIRKKKGVVIKGNVDAELVLHTMIEYPNYEKAVIVTGDGDFRCLMEYLEENSKLARLIVPNRKKYSSLLIPFRKYMLFLNKDFTKKLGKKESK